MEPGTTLAVGAIALGLWVMYRTVKPPPTGPGRNDRSVHHPRDKVVLQKRLGVSKLTPGETRIFSHDDPAFLPDYVGIGDLGAPQI